MEITGYSREARTRCDVFRRKSPEKDNIIQLDILYPLIILPIMKNEGSLNEEYVTTSIRFYKTHGTLLP